jgi:multidrug transporter EmrE-like cation transporter
LEVIVLVVVDTDSIESEAEPTMPVSRAYAITAGLGEVEQVHVTASCHTEEMQTCSLRRPTP